MGCNGSPTRMVQRLMSIRLASGTLRVMATASSCKWPTTGSRSEHEAGPEVQKECSDGEKQGVNIHRQQIP